MVHGFSEFFSLDKRLQADFSSFSQIRTYNDTADSTLPNVPKKRKFDEDEEHTPLKTPKMELEDKTEQEGK